MLYKLLIVVGEDIHRLLTVVGGAITNCMLRTLIDIQRDIGSVDIFMIKFWLTQVKSDNI